MTHGYYINGRGNAHNCMADLRPYFNCDVLGTFNVRALQPISKFKPCIDDADNGRRFWLVRINGEHYAWAYRWADSTQSDYVWELVSKALLPDDLTCAALTLEVMEPMTDMETRAWAATQKYWFQSWPWSPQRADSARVWGAVCDRTAWSGKTVLDIGCHYGYHSFQASKVGARVVAFDADSRPIETARHINDRIEMQDVRFGVEDPGGVVDVILYFSVHHQIDPGYADLARKVAELRARARDKVFVELIVPDFDGRRSLAEIDAMVGGKVLDTYQHKVRGKRRIYELDGKACRS